MSNNILKIIVLGFMSGFTAYAQIDDTSMVVTASPLYTFEAMFRALIVKPTMSNLHFAAEAVPLPLPSPHWLIYDIHPQYHFGFDLIFNVFFHTVNTNLSINWQRFHTSDNACVDVNSDNMVGPFFEIGPDASPYSRAQGTVCIDFDEVNLTYGQQVNFGDRLAGNLFAGISVGRIKEVLTSTYANPEGTIARTIQTPSSFIGAGPQVGVDFIYRIVDGFHFAGKAAAALLTGKLKNCTSYASISPALEELDITPPNMQSTSSCNRTGLVPTFNQRIGFAYVYEFRDHYAVKLEVGYQAHIYLNALQSVDIGSEVVTPPVVPDTIGVFARTFQRTISNFALSGPYVAFDIGF